MIYFEVVDTRTEEMIAGNMNDCPYKDEFLLDKNLTLRDRNLKSCCVEFERVSIWMVVEGESSIVKSNLYFNFLVRSYADTAVAFWDYYLKKVEALSHTLVTIQGQMKQKIEGFATVADFKADSYAESKEKISKLIQEDIDTAAGLLCFLNKKTFDFEACLDGFDVAHLGLSPKDFSLQRVDIKKVLLNIIDAFRTELNQREVFISLYDIDDQYSDNNKIFLDYKTFDLAMHNFIDNIVKYALFGSKVDTFFEKTDDGFSLTFSMISCRIERNELASIFDEGVSGIHATTPGNGIGMYVMRKALLLNDMKIEVIPNYAESERNTEGNYARNHFIISGKASGVTHE